jgi:hypothetical protein
MLLDCFLELRRASIAGVIVGRLFTAWSSDRRSAIDWTWEGLSLGSFGISPFGRFVIRPSIVNRLLGRLAEAGVSLRAFFACWFVIGPSVFCRSLAWASVVGWPLEGLPKYDKVVNGSFASGALEGASPVSRVTVRFSAGFGSSDGPFVGGCSSERPFNCSKVIGDFLVSGVLEGASPAGRITLRFSGIGWSLEGLSKVGGTLEGSSLNDGYTIITNGACWFSERLFIVRDSINAIAVIAAFDYKVFIYALVLREVML